MVNQSPGTTLVVHPQPRFSHSSYPFLVQVTSEKHNYIPLTNSLKSDKIFKAGGILGFIEKAELIPSPQVHATSEIHNDLLPHNDQVKHSGTRSQKLGKLIKSQIWQHLTTQERAHLRQLILKNDPLFILDDKELGLIKGPPAHIKIEDPHPSRGPMYRYPEQAMKMISDMLNDMEDRDIIERSTAA